VQGMDGLTLIFKLLIMFYYINNYVSFLMYKCYSLSHPSMVVEGL